MRTSGALVTVLRAEGLRRGGCKWVFPGGNAAGHVGERRRSLGRAKVRAGLPDQLHRHDLPRTFACLASDAGVPILEISRLLGHSSTAVSQRVYALSGDENLRRASMSPWMGRGAPCDGTHPSTAPQRPNTYTHLDGRNAQSGN